MPLSNPFANRRIVEVVEGIRQHPDAAYGEHDCDCKDRLPFRSFCVQEIDELIPPFSLVFDVERFVLLERRVNQEPKGAACFQHRTVPRVLRQKRTLALTARFQAHAGTT